MISPRHLAISSLLGMVLVDGSSPSPPVSRQVLERAQTRTYPQCSVWVLEAEGKEISSSCRCPAASFALVAREGPLACSICQQRCNSGLRIQKKWSHYNEMQTVCMTAASLIPQQNVPPRFRKILQSRPQLSSHPTKTERQHEAFWARSSFILLWYFPVKTYR